MYGRVYTFYRLLALSFTHNIHEAPNLISTFILMLIIIILSFLTGDMVGVCFIPVHVRMSTFHMYGRVYTHILQVFSPQFHTQHPCSTKLDQYLCFDANNHNLEFR